MPTNQYLPFAIGVSPNVLPFATYEAHALRQSGHVPGVALSEVVNTTLRQTSVAAAGVAKLATDHGPNDCLDDGSPSNFKTALKAALDALYIQDLSGLVPYTQFNGSGRQDVSGTSGWQRFPGDLILQWTSVTLGNTASGWPPTTAVASFPLAVDELLSIQVTMKGGGQFANIWISNETLSSVQVNSTEWADSVQTIDVNILIIGRKAG